MTQPAGQIAQLVPVAGESTSVGITARPAHAMATDAELFARAAVTAGTRNGVEARRHSVLTPTARGGQPTGGMRIARPHPRRDLRRRVAIDARTLGVAGGAEARLSPRFLGVTRPKTCAMEARQPHPVEGESRGQRGDGHPVAPGAGALAVAGRAEIARAGGAHAVLSDPVSIVHQMAHGQCVFGGELHVAAVAVAKRPLLFVLMTAEACGHLGTDHLRPFQSDFHVTANALTAHRRHVSAVGESQVPARELGLAAHVRFAMAMAARPFVMRLGVATHAVGGGRKVHLGVAVGAHPGATTRVRSRVGRSRNLERS